MRCQLTQAWCPPDVRSGMQSGIVQHQGALCCCTEYQWHCWGTTLYKMSDGSGLIQHCDPWVWAESIWKHFLEENVLIFPPLFSQWVFLLLSVSLFPQVGKSWGMGGKYYTETARLGHVAWILPPLWGSSALVLMRTYVQSDGDHRNKQSYGTQQ